MQTIKLLVGNWVEDRIEAVVEKEFDLKSNYYGFGNIPPGQYKVFAWIDVENTGKIEVGDYFYESEIIDFSVGNHSLNLILKEIIN